MAVCTILIAVITFRLYLTASGALLTAVPATYVIDIGGSNHTETLILTCSASKGITRLQLLRIGVHVNGMVTLDNSIIDAEAGAPTVVHYEGKRLGKRLSFSGQVTSTSHVTSTINVVIRDLVQRDGRQYFCYSRAVPGGVTTHAINITARVSGVRLTVTPSNGVIVLGESNPTQTLTLRCGSIQGTRTVKSLRLVKNARGIDNPYKMINTIIEVLAGQKISIKPAGERLKGRMTISGRLRSTTSVTDYIQVVIRDLQPSDGATYICTRDGQPGSFLTHSRSIIARVPMTSLNMLDVIRQDELVVKASQNITLTCETSQASDASDITWSYVPPLAVFSSRTETSGEFRRAVSVISFTVKKNLHGKTFTCASSGINSRTITLLIWDGTNFTAGAAAAEAAAVAAAATTTTGAVPISAGMGVAITLGITIPVILALVGYSVFLHRKYNQGFVEKESDEW